MKANNPLNMAHSLAAQRTQSAFESKKGLSGNLSAEAMQQQLNLAADPGQSRLGLLDGWRARRHESTETLKTATEVITHRENKIRKLATDAIDAQITLMSTELKQRFDTEFAVIAERGLASFAQAQSSFYAVVDAGADQIYESLYARVNDLTARHTEGRYSDLSFQNEMVRAMRQAELQIGNLETSCAKRIDALNNAFNT